MRGQYKLWTEAEVEQAAAIWERDHVSRYGGARGPNGSQLEVCTTIAEALGRSVGSVLTRFQDCGPAFVGRRKAHPAAIVLTPEEYDRQRRNEARDRMNLTGLVLGDPPPGYSALDKMRGLNP